jgi:hypothetical protein
MLTFPEPVYTVSKETRKKLSAALIEIPHSEETRRKLGLAASRKLVA